jgi:CheY-like chemotaxis protein
VGSGTTFDVELPFERIEEPIVEPSATRRERRVPARLGHVLVAEDNPINQQVARAMLERLGWIVDVVSNGSEAVEAVASHDYDLVIVDCQMPVLDGYGAAEAIRGLPAPKCSVPIVAMTASVYPEDRDKCFDAGMNDYIAKPVTTTAVADAIERVLAA